MKTGYTVADAMTQEPIFVTPKTSVSDAAKTMKEFKVGSLLIKDNEQVVGICTERDMVFNIIAEDKKASSLSVEEIMTRNLKTISADKDIFDALMVMRDYNIRRLPVVNGSDFVGLLTLKDVLKIEPQLFDLLVDTMDIREAESKPVRNINPDASDEVDDIINGRK
ncbi:MAG: cyclic nucleotide-binding/CBS domain-containing protein [Candidatus Woesearchaeota archaeon]